MKVYLDTGVFVDYLIYRGITGHFLRKRGRRNRSVKQLHQDVSMCLHKIGKMHDGFTSSLTLYEAEEALYSYLWKSTKGVRYRKAHVIISSRNVPLQVLAIKDRYNLQILDLSEDIVERHVGETRLIRLGVRAADSLHMVTAILNDADILISTDLHLLALNKTFQNQKGKYIECLDTNKAKNVL